MANNDVKSEPEILIATDLEKMTKKELISLITTLQNVNKQEERREQWGQQFDIWLIRSSKKERVIDFVISDQASGLLENVDDSILTGIPRRIDRYEIQIETLSGQAVWINKDFIAGCKEHKSNKQEVEEAA